MTVLPYDPRMTQRSKSYRGTFNNNKKGIRQYKKLLHEVRSTDKTIRVRKMYRNGTRRVFGRCSGFGTIIRSGTTLKKGSTHFDVYVGVGYK